MRKVYLEFSGIAQVTIDVPITGNLIVRANEGINIDKAVKNYLLKRKETTGADFELDQVLLNDEEIYMTLLDDRKIPISVHEVVSQELDESVFKLIQLDNLNVVDSK